MTHNAAHLVLQALATPTPAASKYRCWHVALASLLVGFVLGAIVL